MSTPDAAARVPVADKPAQPAAGPISCHVERWQQAPHELPSACVHPRTRWPRAQDEEGGGSSRERNEVLAYLRQAPSAEIHRLRAGDDVAEAMSAFLARLLGTTDPRELNSVVSETSAQELSRLLSWLMIVGYTLRSMEIRLSMEQSFALPHVALGGGTGAGDA